MPDPRFRPFATTVGLTSLVVTGFVASLRLLGALEADELRAYDRFTRMQKPAPMDERVLVVGIGEEDIQELEQYPLYDGTLAEALRKLEAQDPRVIGVDVARDIPQGPAEGRQQLLDTIGSSDRIIMACLFDSLNEPGVPPPSGVPMENVAFADFPLDADGVVRRTSLLSVPYPAPDGALAQDIHVCVDDSPENEMLSLGFLTSQIYLQAEGVVPTPGKDRTQLIELGSAMLSRLGTTAGGYARSGATDFQIMLRYRAPKDSVRQVSLQAVLQNKVDPSWVEDRIVMIGYTSQVAKDIVKTPYLETAIGQRGIPGVVVHAQAASQLLSAALDGRPLMRVWSEFVEVLWIGLWAVTAGALTFYSQRLSWFSLLAGFLTLSCWAGAYLIFVQGWWAPLIPCLWAMVITAAAVGVIDRANRGGYTQAIFEQLQDQLQGQNGGGGDRNDYLTGLVHRARVARLKRSGQSVDPATLAVDPLNLQFDSPEMQRIYDAMRQKAEQEAQKKASSRVSSADSVQHPGQTQQRLGRLLNRAKAARGDDETSLRPGNRIEHPGESK